MKTWNKILFVFENCIFWTLGWAPHLLIIASILFIFFFSSKLANFDKIHREYQDSCRYKLIVGMGSQNKEFFYVNTFEKTNNTLTFTDGEGKHEIHYLSFDIIDRGTK